MGKTPVRARKSKNAQLKSDLELKADGNFLRCPKGHSLPHKTDQGKCTPLTCAVETGMTRVRPEKLDDPEERVTKVQGDEEMRVKVQSARKEVWNKFLGIPMDLKGGDAEKYADDELVNMLPFAVGVVKKQLLYGTEEQQERAALRVLDANGKAKKEASVNTTPSIVINMVTTSGEKVVDAKVTSPTLPWRKTVNAQPALPEGEKK